MSAGQVFSNWTDFVYAIGRDRANGSDAKALSEKYKGATVSWTGTIRKNQTNDQYAPGMQMSMPRVEVPLGSERKLVADYVFLNVSEKAKSLWATLDAGKTIQFEASIKGSAGVFLPVDIEVFPGEAEEVLTLALENASPIGIEKA